MHFTSVRIYSFHETDIMIICNEPQCWMYVVYQNIIQNDRINRGDQVHSVRDQA